MDKAIANSKKCLLTNVSLPYIPLVLMIALSCWSARQTALHINKQTDVVDKKASETYEDFSACALVIILLAIARPQMTKWPCLVTMPCAAAIFAWISDLKPLQASLNAPTIGLKIALGAVAVLLVTTIVFMGWTEPNAMVPLAMTLLVAVLYIATLYLASWEDGRRGVTTETHIHHWQIGLLLAVLFSNFHGILGTGLAAVGLGIVCHGLSVYRLTSPFCGFRVPCSVTHYKDVPKVPVA